MTASYAIGFVIGPLAGGAAYDGGGSTAAFGLAAGLAVTGLLVALAVPETQLRSTVRRRTTGGRRWSLPSRPVRVLLSIDFLVMFAFGFIAPQLVFFAFDVAGLTTTQYGLVVAASSLAMATGQTLLGGLSDRLGRKPVVVVGLFVYAVTFPLYVPFHTPLAIVAIAATAGFAFGILAPAFTAFYLDAADDAQRSTILGVRTSVMSAGAFLGPLVLVVVRAWASAEVVFVATGIGLLAPAVIAAVSLRSPTEAPGDGGVRAQIAGATLLGVIAQANTSRTRGQDLNSSAPMPTSRSSISTP